MGRQVQKGGAGRQVQKGGADRQVQKEGWRGRYRGEGRGGRYRRRGGEAGKTEVEQYVQTGAYEPPKASSDNQLH